MITKFAIWKEQSSVSPGNLLMHPHTVDCWYVLFPSYPPLGYSPLGFFAPLPSRCSSPDLFHRLRGDLALSFLARQVGKSLVPFSTFCAALLFFLWAAIFLGLGFCFLWALNPCLSSHTSPISWLPPFWGWADVFTVHLGLSIYSFTVLHLFTPNFTWQRLL